MDTEYILKSFSNF